MNLDPNPAAWVGLAFALVLLASYGLAEPIRLTLILVIAYVLLTHAARFAPALDRLNAALGARSPAPTGGGRRSLVL